jgi:hypothetical protein
MDSKKPQPQSKSPKNDSVRFKQVVFKGHGLTEQAKNMSLSQLREVAYGLETDAKKRD